MKTPIRHLFAVLALFAGVHQIAAQGTAFTYQGQLQNNGAPANGSYDLQFVLFTTNQFGSPAAPILTNAAVAVNNGLFTTTLDFGDGFFTGTNYWLDIGVRTNGSGTFTELNPRQPVTPTPYAVFANTANNVNGLTIQPNTNGAPNVINGSSANFVSSGVIGATISGGGVANYFGSPFTNNVTGDFGTVGGGDQNTAGQTATVGGGDGNTANGQLATVSGGYKNSASVSFSTVSGGDQNTATSEGTTVSGGEGNRASAVVAMVGGGYTNTASGEEATVSGGDNNIASGTNATVPGGEFDMASGEFSFAAGQQARALHDGAFVWADSQNATFSSTRSNQFSIRAGGGVVMNVSGSAGLNPAAVTINSTSSTGVGLVVNQSSSDTSALFANNGTGDLLKGFSGGGNTVFEVLNDGTVKSKNVTLTSDRNVKENFTTLDAQTVLAKVTAMPVTEWNYKTDDAEQKHIGPMAQDFHAAFDLNGADDKHISVVDEGGVALAAIQGLNQKVEAQNSQLNKKDIEIQELNQRLDALEKIILNRKSN